MPAYTRAQHQQTRQTPLPPVVHPREDPMRNIIRGSAIIRSLVVGCLAVSLDVVIEADPHRDRDRSSTTETPADPDVDDHGLDQAATRSPPRGRGAQSRCTNGGGTSGQPTLAFTPPYALTPWPLELIITPNPDIDRVRIQSLRRRVPRNARTRDAALSGLVGRCPPGSDCSEDGLAINCSANRQASVVSATTRKNRRRNAGEKPSRWTDTRRVTANHQRDHRQRHPRRSSKGC